MIRASAAALLLLVASPSALAQDASPLEPAFGNTIVSTYPDGRTAKTWLNKDGTYRGVSRRGKQSSGRWSIKGEEVCFRQSRPFPAPMAYCAPLQRGDVGTKWSGKAVTGEPIRLELVAGR